MAGFEQNQQDAFNQRNAIESIKQSTADLDRFAATIGEAELAAEEELAADKLKNLAELNKNKLKQLEQFIALEEASIKELAELRLTLSEKQFEARKKALRKERKLIEETAGKPVKNQPQPQKNSSKQSSSAQSYANDASGLKKVDLGRFSFESVTASFEALREQLSSSALHTLNKVVANKDNTSQSSIDFAGELLENFDAAEAAIRKVKEFNEEQELNTRLLQLSEEQQLKKQHATASFNNIKAEIAAIAKERDILNNREAYADEAGQKLSIEHISKENTLRLAAIDAEAKAQDLIDNKAFYALEERIALENAHSTAANSAELARIAAAEKAEDLANNKALYLLEEKQALEKTYIDAQNKLVEDRIKTEAALAYTRANRDELIAQEEQKLKQGHADATLKAMQTNIAIVAKSNDLEHNRRVYANEEYRALSLSFLAEQNKLTEDQIKAEAKVKFVNANKGRIQEQEAHKLRKAHAEAESSAELARISAAAQAEDIRSNRANYLQEAFWKQQNAFAEEHNKLQQALVDAEAARDFQKDPANAGQLKDLESDKLRLAHINAEGEALKALRAADAKANDLEHNRKLYAEEEYRSLRIANAEEQNKLTKDQIKAEAKRKFVNANKDKLRNQEAHKLRIGHIDAETNAEQAKIAAAVKAEDIKHNRGLYLQEAFWSRQNAFAEEQNRLQQAIIDAEADRDFQKDPANAGQLKELESDKLRLTHINAEGEALKALRAADAKAADLQHNKELYFQEETWALEKTYVDTQNKLVEDRIKTEAALAYTGANRAKLIAQEEQKLKNEHAATSLRAMQANIAAVAKANDLEHNRKLYAEEEYRALRVAFQEEQNKLTTEEIQAEAKLKFVNANQAKLLDQAAHKLRIGHINAEHDAMQALIDAQAKKDDLKNNRDQYLKESKQKLEVGHVNKQNDLEQAGIDIEAKAADLTDNKDQYILEARMARENAFYEERNRQAEELIQLETDLAWEKAHSDDIIAQELQKKRLGYLKEYQGHQQKAGKYAVDQAKFERDRAKKANDAAKKEAVNGMVDGLKKFGTGEFSMTDVKQAYGEYMGQRTAELKESGMDEASAELTAQFELLASAAGSLADALDAKVKEISAVQGVIDTRLQGSQSNDRDFLGSYWNKLLQDARQIAGASPFIKQEKLVDNMKALVEKGISFDIKQRAFLMTIQEKIANTFNVADGTLLRLIRIQQQDTTAGRLGMESALNSFLNSMYETSEYLESVAKNVRDSLQEMQALMEGAAATEIEYQVQKWMGSLYSVGMSDSAVQSIAQAFGQVASGDVGGLTGSGAGNLIIMAANEAGKSVADILQKGLDADETNDLMQAMVNYLAEIADSSSDSRVVQQQLANVYGIKASDLRAATNLASSVKDVSKSELTYDGMMKQLEKMMNTIRFRTSIGEGLTNMWDNVMYSMASTQASNPILYLLPKMATLLKDVTGGEGQGGIALPFLNVYGFGVDLNTTVSDLMLVASMAGTALGALGPAITGLVDLVNPLVGTSMLNRAGIKTSGSGKIPVLARGSAQPLQNLAGASTSESGLVGNSSGDDIKNATMQDAEDDKKKQMVEAKEEETADDVAMKADLAVVNIYNLLEEVAHGSQSLRVRLVNGNGGAINSLGCNCNHGDGQGSINNTSSNGATTGIAGAGASGSDNGNWVLAF